MNKTFRTQKTIEFFLDTVVLLLISLVFCVLFFHLFGNLIFYFQNGYILTYCLYMLVFGVFLSIYGGFKFQFSKISDIIFSTIISIFLTDLIFYFQNSLNAARLLDFWKMLLIVSVQIVCAGFTDYFCWKLFYKLFPAKDTLLVYQNECKKFKEKLLRYHDQNFVINEAIRIKNDSSIAFPYIAENDYILLIDLDSKSKREIVNYCYSLSKTVFEIPNTYEIITNNAIKLHMIDTPLFELGKFGPSQLSKIIKRMLDIIFSLVALIILSPLFLACAVAIKRDDNGPIFYKQARLTQYGHEFQILKFRSMKVDAENDGIAQMAKENDDRITRVGKTLRRYRLDELPQLINILNGDMSIVGPRPERPEIADLIYKSYPEFEFRLKVKAGLTGYAQVYGKYNTTLEDKLLLDLMYIENYSIALDIKIVLMTIKTIFMKESTEGF